MIFSLQLSEGPLVEQLDVPVLHVLLVSARGPLSLLLAGEHSLSVPRGSAVREVLDDHVSAGGHGTEPL